jgi:hypothetical protein
MSARQPHWHVVWVTHLAWPPTDQRGDWQALADFYSELSASGLSVITSETMPERWNRCPPRGGVVKLSDAARSCVAADLQALASSDRVAGGTQIRAAEVGQLSVQLLVSCPQASMNQRIARLKSRSATLLTFRTELGVGGRGTWGKGIWWARIDDQATLKRVENFFAKSTSPVSESPANGPCA